MQVGDWLKSAEIKLADNGIATGRLDALVLLEDCLQKNRAWLLANSEFVIKPLLLEEINNLLSRRAQHEPLAYIRGKTEFYGREFYVNSSVLEPRPETESMIECLLNLPDISPNWWYADVGTGSGAIGITVALELQTDKLILLDIEKSALKVAKTNVDKFTLSINTKLSNLIADTDRTFDVLLCNLPYVPDSFHINLAASYEPAIAIFGGKDGLDIYRQLFTQVAKTTARPLYILTESLPPQQPELKELANDSGYLLTKTSDFIQVFKRH
ncbi:MAG TPA: HemK/PrmC family methyltransferase [Candidatus Saccharimonadales bacterium]|nr:HemK/PrmC family methyltransferase [Candidatus Saccharimonadales bacterium]